MELCSGCGAVASSHPMIGIAKDEDGTWAAFPVCGACHVDPAHRQRTLDMTFFPREQRAIALALAGSANVGG